MGNIRYPERRLLLQMGHQDRVACPLAYPLFTNLCQQYLAKSGEQHRYDSSCFFNKLAERALRYNGFIQERLKI